MGMRGDEIRSLRWEMKVVLLVTFRSLFAMRITHRACDLACISAAGMGSTLATFAS
jgi:hypothetical protein